ncbi:TEN4 protein, partial [Polypterus senegalus]
MLVLLLRVRSGEEGGWMLERDFPGEAAVLEQRLIDIVSSFSFSIAFSSVDYGRPVIPANTPRPPDGALPAAWPIYGKDQGRRCAQDTASRRAQDGSPVNCSSTSDSYSVPWDICLAQPCWLCGGCQEELQSSTLDFHHTWEYFQIILMSHLKYSQVKGSCLASLEEPELGGGEGGQQQQCLQGGVEEAVTQEREGKGISPPLHCSSASSTPIEQSPSPPPSLEANESQRRLLGNGVPQPTPDIDSEEEFAPNSFLVKTSSGNFYATAPAADDQTTTFQNHARLRTPPLPLSHSQNPNQHHASSINSLNRGNYTPRSNPSPAPTDHSAPTEVPTSAQESGCAQDNWLLNSNIPLETRNIAKQTFLETLQDNFIEMDILASARHDGSYNEGHFLFKPGGTSPLFCTTSPGYPLTSSTVYSPPPRPLPRSTFSRPAFSLKKPYKYCNWKCAALSAIIISVTLVILLAYFIAMHLFGLNWHLQPMQRQMYQLAEDRASSLPAPTDLTVSPSGGTGLELPDRKGKGIGMGEGKPDGLFPEETFIDMGEIDIGRKVTQKIPPGIFWRSQVFIDHPMYLKFNVSLGKDALVGIYGRRGLPPSHTQFDFVELLDGRRLLAQEVRGLEGPQRQHRSLVPITNHDTGFIQYLDSGIWHLAVYNDGKEAEQVSFITTVIESVDECPSNCYGNGDCVSGTCHCFLGFLGPDCGREGCPGLCNGNGRCTLDQNGWNCVCQLGWRGSGCDTSMETACSDGKDNDNDPLDVIQQTQAPSTQANLQSFYDRIRFLVGKDSTHIIPGENPFNVDHACVIRGQVMTSDGTPLVGVNISFINNPLYGYTISRQDGSFDLITNGGVAIILRFERAPFITQEHTLWLPWGRFYVMDAITMRHEENEIPSCDLSSFARPNPIVSPAPLTAFAASCSDRGTIVPEIQVLQEEINIPGCKMKLSYLSSRTPGYKSVLRVILTHSSIPFNLMKVHLMVAVEGRLFRKWFPAAPDLSYYFIWDKTDVYSQKVYGLSEAFVSVGYEYESCPDLILWEKRTAVLQGYEMDASNLDGWTLDKHHALNIQSGILHKGNGENLFISQQPPIISSIMGNGRKRSTSCPSCNGLADGNKLLAPAALACGSDGSLYVGDFNYIRRIYSGNVTSVLELSSSPAHKYYLATSPVSGAVYLSDTNSRKVFKIKSLTIIKDVAKNFEVVAGTGDQCLPFDETRCGDGGKAVEATLTNPRGITVDKLGFIYFVDGTMIRRIDQNGIISTLLGSNDLTSARPLSCDSVMDISQVRLEWPTDLAVSPMDNSLYVLDNNVVLQISENHQVRIVAGRPMHCQVPGIDHFLLSKVAVHATLESATALAVSHNGILYIAESDEKKINRVRQVTTNGEISLVAGAPSGCDCKNDANCDCYSGDDGYAKDAKLNAPLSLAVSPEGELFIADLGNIRIRYVRKNKPFLNPHNLYEVSSPIDGELYLFDTNGSHIYTQSLITGDYLYNITYTGNGDISSITDNNGNTLKITRDGTGMPLWLVVPDGQEYWLTIGTNNALKSITAQGHELAMMTYHGNSGLLATKSDENGWTTFYEYDGYGRLTNVTFPTGHISSYRTDTDSSVKVQVESSNKEDVTITTNLSASGTFYTLLQDQVRNSYYIGLDGSLKLVLANGMEVSLHTEPHLLAGTVNPTVGKRNVTLPIDNGLNLVEWRQRKEQARGQVTVFGRRLRVHNRNLLSLDFDRITRTEKVYDDHRKFTLRIHYDHAGRPTLWSPSSRLNGVNVTYSPGGYIAGIQRGTMSVRMEYDQTGRIISQIFADGKSWSYTYLEKSMVLLLYSQRQYIFEFDKNDRLSSVTMPNVARQTLETIRSIGYYRNIYRPPEGNASFLQDFSEEGQLLQTAYLGTGRRVIYKYGKLAKLSEILYDTTKIAFSYDEAAGMLKTVNLQTEGFTCTIRYRQIGPLIDRQIFRFSEEGMVNARFDYNYDNSFRVTSMQAVINETPLPIDLYRYDDVSGKTEQFGKFGVIYYDINQIITTPVMTHTKHFDAYGRVKEVQYEIFRSLMYWMMVQYDNMGRVVSKELKVGPYANTTRYSYEYDADGQLQTVSINDKPLWRYSYDLNGNLHLLSPGNSARLTPLRYDSRDRITRLGDVQYRMDEDGFLRQRGNDFFDYNSDGLLVKAYNKVTGWNIRYRYDGLGRRVSSKSSYGHHLQFFYADLSSPMQVTHMYNHSSSEITSLYYDLQGHLFAMELSSGDEFYVACDNIGTPLAVFSGTGLMIKQILHTAYGEVYMDTNPSFQLIIGYQGGLYEPLTKLVHMGRRDYDVLAGRWATPDHNIWKRLNNNNIMPFNLYMFKNNNPVSNAQEIKCYMTDVNSWLLTFGFQLYNVIPGYPKPDTDAMEPSYELISTQMKTQEWDSSKSILGVQCEVQKQLKAFVKLELFGQIYGASSAGCLQNEKKNRFASGGSIFGKGVKFALKDGRVTTDIISLANEDGRRTAAILNGAYYLQDLHFTISGVDTHYFIKLGPPESDLSLIGMTGGRRTLENGVNVTVSQVNTVLNGRTRRYTDIQLQYGALCLNTRYGTTMDEEKVRVLELARQRAVAHAWATEQQRLRDGEEGTRAWTEGEKQQLLSTGRVLGYDGYFVISVDQYPELSDSVNNIHFMRQSEMGKR